MPIARNAKPRQSKREARVVGRQARRDAEQRERADRHVDQEHPVPAVGVGQPAAERRAENRANHDAHAP